MASFPCQQRQPRGYVPKPLRQGVDYFEFHLYLAETDKVISRLRSANKRRMRKKLKRFRHAYRTGKIDASDVQRSVRSYQAHLRHGDTWHLQRRMLDHLVLCRSTFKEQMQDRENPYG